MRGRPGWLPWPRTSTPNRGLRSEGDAVQGMFATIGALVVVILFGWLVSGNGSISEEWKMLLVKVGLFGSVLTIIVLSWDYIISDQP